VSFAVERLVTVDCARSLSLTPCDVPTPSLSVRPARCGVEWSGVGSSTHSQPEPGRQLREGIRGVDSSKIRLNRPPLNQGVARERGNTSERKARYGHVAVQRISRVLLSCF
jgi:hypothetical protein